METQQSCPDCGHHGCMTTFDEGNTYCHSCELGKPAPKGDRVVAITEGFKNREASPLLRDIAIDPLVKRRISQDTCRKYGYGIAQDRGRAVQVAPYHDDTGRLVAQKTRTSDKKMMVHGTMPGTLFGQHLFRPNAKLRLVITEGEIDALSVYETQGDWPCVSVPTGAAGAVKAIARNLHWVEGFKEVVIAFDMDEPGRKAAELVARLLSPGKAYIAHLPDGAKDPSDMLQAGDKQALRDALWKASPYRPTGIVHCSDLWDEVNKDIEPAFAKYPWSNVNDKLCGLRPGEIVTWTAGSGIGKSTATREIVYALTQAGHKVGVIALEESVKQTILYQCGIHLNTHVHLGHGHVKEKDMRAAFDAVTPNLWAHEHWGSMASDTLADLVRYLAVGEGCNTIVLDHVSMVVSGMETQNERKDLDILMTNLRTLAETLQVNVQAVVHIKRIEGKAANEGAKLKLTDLRGSAALEQLSDQVVALERNQQGDNPTHTHVRVLKNRPAGWLMGSAGYLRYDDETGRLVEVTDFDAADGKDEF